VNETFYLKETNKGKLNGNMTTVGI